MKKKPTRAELSQQAENQLKAQARHSLAYHYPYFPDVPQPHENLLLSPLLEILKVENDHFSRKFTASTPSSYHPAFGFPETWYERIGGGRFPRKAERISPDLELVKRFYPKNERIDMFEKLDRIASEVAHSRIPRTDDEVLDSLRFLGLTSEDEFIEKTEAQLIARITQKGGDVTRLRQFMEFARNSDSLRTKKRRTGENYYCHYLASAWLLWTMAEKNLTTPDEIAEAVADTETMMVHDIMEDL